MKKALLVLSIAGTVLSSVAGYLCATSAPQGVFVPAEKQIAIPRTADQLAASREFLDAAVAAKVVYMVGPSSKHDRRSVLWTGSNWEQVPFDQKLGICLAAYTLHCPNNEYLNIIDSPSGKCVCVYSPGHGLVRVPWWQQSFPNVSDSFSAGRF